MRPCVPHDKKRPAYGLHSGKTALRRPRRVSDGSKKNGPGGATPGEQETGGRWEARRIGNGEKEKRWEKTIYGE